MLRTFDVLQCFRDDQQRVVPRSFLCKGEEGGGDASIVLDLHAMPVNFASVCFVKAVDVARQCLERRLLDLGFVEELAMKVAYLELSNVFTLLDENVTWVCGGGGGKAKSSWYPRNLMPMHFVKPSSP